MTGITDRRLSPPARLPHSPLTQHELNERAQGAAWKAACALTPRYGLPPDVEGAKELAVEALRWHEAAVARMPTPTPAVTA